MAIFLFGPLAFKTIRKRSDKSRAKMEQQSGAQRPLVVHGAIDRLGHAPKVG
jgi:hypothetical protein